ncbi:uncharacterized protein LOC129639166 isoform X7 [Bubalus kerabau]|uniref:uncharacterized protein LOC129639166 isoform X7 n=1 Tax=Bubalus carabanensis TaxID=3119969 RepID=UPI00244EBD4B|nr:uncharacterized protein LOC129639166 isoform X7 [Bubalus carabanensis]
MPVSGGEAHLLARPVSGRCKSCKQGRLEAEKIEEKRIWFGWILEGNRPRPEPFCPACFAHRRCPASYSWSGNLQTFFLVSWCDVKLCWEKGAFGKETVIMEKERKQQTSNSKQHETSKLKT